METPHTELLASDRPPQTHTGQEGETPILPAPSRQGDYDLHKYWSTHPSPPPPKDQAGPGGWGARVRIWQTRSLGISKLPAQVLRASMMKHNALS